MARPDTVVAAIERDINNASDINVNTLVHEVGPQDADVELPAVAIYPITSIRANEWNTDFVRYVTDNTGNHIGEVYEALFDMTLQIDVWTAQGSSTDLGSLSGNIRKELYLHDAHFRDTAFVDADGNDITDIKAFRIASGRRTDDITTTHTLRRFTIEADVSFVEVVDTTAEVGDEEYVATVLTPEDGDFVGGSGDVSIVFDATPSADSTADDYT